MGFAIDIQDFSVRRGSFLLDRIHLHIDGGEIFAILGKTGSGKTVLLESIAGMYKGESGIITADGVSIAALPVQERRIGFVYQDYQLFPHMTVEENISYGLRMKKVDIREQKQRVQELLEMFDIVSIRNRYPGVLSGGEKQRTAFARALSLNPELLILDEPFSALDPVTKELLCRELEKIHEKFSCTILFVTHNYKETQRLADRVGIMENGRLTEVTDADLLFTTEYGKRIQQFLGGEGYDES